METLAFCLMYLYNGQSTETELAPWPFQSKGFYFICIKTRFLIIVIGLFLSIYNGGFTYTSDVRSSSDADYASSDGSVRSSDVTVRARIKGPVFSAPIVKGGASDNFGRDAHNRQLRAPLICALRMHPNFGRSSSERPSRPRSSEVGARPKRRARARLLFSLALYQGPSLSNILCRIPRLVERSH